MRKYRKVSLLIFLMLASNLVLEVSCVKNTWPGSNTPTPVPPVDEKSDTPLPSVPAWFVFPIDQWRDRVTKKTFWLKVSPKDSPVSPEKFSGYHTGVDFEIFAWEVDKEVTIKTICSGPLLMKKWSTGYGGVVVQKCELNKEIVTVVYGHLNLGSVKTSINGELKAGETLGILGKWYSSETDNERKHLHLSIHKWWTVNITGYAETVGELNQWLNPVEYLK